MKSKYKQSKAEANNTQNTLQKEITALRDSNRTLHLKVRDMEVQNDDFEKQTRNQTSSLEDLESKHNVAIERGAMLEDEMKQAEQEREGLRIKNQRLRDELSEQKVELEILQSKLQRAESALDRAKERSPIADALRPPSPLSEASTTATTVSSPSVSTPPPVKSDQGALQTTPPSPPLSEVSAAHKRSLGPITPVPSKTRGPALPGTTPRPSGLRAPRHSRGPSMPTSTPAPQRTQAPPMPGSVASKSTRRIPSSRLSTNTASHERPGIPPPSSSSRSLHQIRGLIGKMQKLEERVHTARSKLPAPSFPSTPPGRSVAGGSPRQSLSGLPGTVTVRSSRKRPSASTSAAASANGDAHNAAQQPPRSASRLSFGFSAGPGAANPTPASASRPGSRAAVSRPGSRASLAPGASAQPTFARPSSRASVSGRSQFGDAPMPGTLHRSRSSISGSYAMSMNGVGVNGAVPPMPPRCTTPGPKMATLPSSSSAAGAGQQHMFSRSVSAVLDGGGARRGSGIPAPSGTGLPLPKRVSGGASLRRQSGATDGAGAGEMRPPSRKGRAVPLRMAGLGETF
jgi:hypothetical protein